MESENRDNKQHSTQLKPGTRLGKKDICKQTQSVVMNVYRFFQRLADDPVIAGNLNFNQVQKLTADACGISRTSVQNIKKKMKRTEKKEIPTFDTPRKHYKRNRVITDLDCFQEDVVRRSVFQFYERGEYPNAEKIRADLAEKINFKGSARSILRILKEIGFEYRRSSNGRKILMERRDIACARAKFLRAMNDSKSDATDRPKFYLDENWVNQKHSKNYIWQDSNEEYIGIEPDDLNLSTVDVEKKDVKPAIPDPLDVNVKKEIEDPLCFDEDININASDKEQKLDLKVTDPRSCATDADMFLDTNLAHKKIGLKTVNVNELFGRELLSRNIEGRKPINDPEEGTSFGSKRPITCLNSDCVNFVGIQNSKLENSPNEKYECDACGENSTSDTVIDKSEFHHSVGEYPSNLSQLEISEDYIRKLFKNHDMPISSHDNAVDDRNISESGGLKKEKEY